MILYIDLQRRRSRDGFGHAQKENRRMAFFVFCSPQRFEPFALFDLDFHSIMKKGGDGERVYVFSPAEVEWTKGIGGPTWASEREGQARKWSGEESLIVLERGKIGF